MHGVHHVVAKLRVRFTSFQDPAEVREEPRLSRQMLRNLPVRQRLHGSAEQLGIGYGKFLWQHGWCHAQCREFPRLSDQNSVGGSGEFGMEENAG